MSVETVLKLSTHYVNKSVLLTEIKCLSIHLTATRIDEARLKLPETELRSYKKKKIVSGLGISAFKSSSQDDVEEVGTKDPGEDRHC